MACNSKSIEKKKEKETDKLNYCENKEISIEHGEADTVETKQDTKENRKETGEGGYDDRQHEIACETQCETQCERKENETEMFEGYVVWCL